MSAKLYEKCPAYPPKPTDSCRICRGAGFIETGLTVGQVERATRDRELFYTQRCNLKGALIPFVRWMGAFRDGGRQVGNFDMAHIDRARKALRDAGWIEPDVPGEPVPEFEPSQSP